MNSHLIPGAVVSNPYGHTTTSYNSTYVNTDPYASQSVVTIMGDTIEQLRTEVKFLRLKILALEGKFDKEEVSNLRKMLMSKDEASITLADTIIENA